MNVIRSCDITQSPKAVEPLLLKRSLDDRRRVMWIQFSKKKKNYLNTFFLRFWGLFQVLTFSWKTITQVRVYDVWFLVREIRLRLTRKRIDVARARDGVFARVVSSRH